MQQHFAERLPGEPVRNVFCPPLDSVDEGLGAQAPEAIVFNFPCLRPGAQPLELLVDLRLRRRALGRRRRRLWGRGRARIPLASNGLRIETSDPLWRSVGWC